MDSLSERELSKAWFPTAVSHFYTALQYTLQNMHWSLLFLSYGVYGPCAGCFLFRDIAASCDVFLLVRKEILLFYFVLKVIRSRCRRHLSPSWRLVRGLSRNHRGECKPRHWSDCSEASGGVEIGCQPRAAFRAGPWQLWQCKSLPGPKRGKETVGNIAIKLKASRNTPSVCVSRVAPTLLFVFGLFFFLLYIHSFLAETKPARVLHSFPSSFPLLLCPSPSAHKRWRLMNSALMHASANYIGIGNSSQYYKMFSPSRWPPAGRTASVTLRSLAKLLFAQIMTIDVPYIGFLFTCWDMKLSQHILVTLSTDFTNTAKSVKSNRLELLLRWIVSACSWVWRFLSEEPL